MKTAEQVFQEELGFGLIENSSTISLTKRDIYPAMEAYAKQKEREHLLAFSAWLYKVDGQIEVPIYTDIVDKYLTSRKA